MAYGIRTEASAALPTNGCTGNNHAVSESVDFGKRIVTAKLKVVNLADYENCEDGKSPYYEITLEEYTLSVNYMMFLQ